SVDAADAGGHRSYRALRAHLDAGIQVLDAALDELGDFRRVELHERSLSFEGGFERRELRARRAVDNLVAEHDLHPADQLAIHRNMRPYLAAGLLFQTRDDVLELRAGELEGRL